MSDEEEDPKESRGERVAYWLASYAMFVVMCIPVVPAVLVYAFVIDWTDGYLGEIAEYLGVIVGLAVAAGVAWAMNRIIDPPWRRWMERRHAEGRARDPSEDPGYTQQEVGWPHRRKCCPSGGRRRRGG